jgi:hypothetical protein
MFWNKNKGTAEEKLEGIRKAITKIIEYPGKDHSRRTKDGYPLEFVYDEFAYQRIVDSYRDALKRVLEDFS